MWPAWLGPGAPHLFEQNFISCGHKQSEAGRGAGHGASWAGDKRGKVEIRCSAETQSQFIPQHYHDHPILGQLALAPLGGHGAVAGRVYGRHHGRQVVGPRPGAGGGGHGGQGRHPALQRGELQPGPVQGSTRLSADQI